MRLPTKNIQTDAERFQELESSDVLPLTEPSEDAPELFWTAEERLLFNDLRSIEESNLKNYEKSHYTKMAEFLFANTNYYARGLSIKSLLWSKLML